MNTKNAKKQEKKHEGLKSFEFEVTNVRVTESDKVYFTLNLNGVHINNCRVATGSKGDFVSFPSLKTKQGTYYNYAYASLSDDQTAAIMAAIQEAIDA